MFRRVADVSANTPTHLLMEERPMKITRLLSLALGAALLFTPATASAQAPPP